MLKIHSYYTETDKITGEYYWIKEYHLFGILIKKIVIMKNIKRIL